MRYERGKLIAIVIALIFVLLSAAVSVGVVAHGVRSFGADQSLSASEEIQQKQEERARKKAQKKAEREAEKQSKATTEKQTKKQSKTKTEKQTTKTKTQKAKAAASKETTTTKRTTTTRTTTKRTTTKKSTTKKATTKRSTTKKATTRKTTQKADGTKVVYLTFDDGPGQYTDKLLGILKKHNVKATFFVTNCYPDYQNCIAKEYKAGHTVAIHTYTHDYSKVYASDKAYWQDFNKMNAIVEKQTGHKTTMFRFPGGSSNTVSRRYNTGIMSRLVKQSAEKGYTYYDWNVTSGDAGETTSSEQVYQNIIKGVQQQKQSIVLCHDIKSYTVNAMDRTISWCLDHGYTFKVLTPGGFTVHHGVAN